MTKLSWEMGKIEGKRVKEQNLGKKRDGRTIFFPSWFR